MEIYTSLLSFINLISQCFNRSMINFTEANRHFRLRLNGMTNSVALNIKMETPGLNFTNVYSVNF